MSDGSPPDDDLSKSLAKIEARLASSEPVLTYYFDGPITVSTTAGGGIAVDCPSVQIAGIDRLGVVRMLLTLESAGTLQRALRELEKILGEPFGEGTPHGPQ